MNADSIVIESVDVRQLVDDDPDLSWLDQTDDQMGEGFESASADRKASYGNVWEMIGVQAIATVRVTPGIGSPTHHSLQTITSGGLWGIESDSDDAYLAEVEAEQLEELRGILLAMGCSPDDPLLPNGGGAPSPTPTSMSDLDILSRPESQPADACPDCHGTGTVWEQHGTGSDAYREPLGCPCQDPAPPATGSAEGATDADLDAVFAVALLDASESSLDELAEYEDSARQWNPNECHCRWPYDVRHCAYCLAQDTAAQAPCDAHTRLRAVSGGSHDEPDLRSVVLRYCVTVDAEVVYESDDRDAAQRTYALLVRFGKPGIAVRFYGRKAIDRVGPYVEITSAIA